MKTYWLLGKDENYEQIHAVKNKTTENNIKDVTGNGSKSRISGNGHSRISVRTLDNSKESVLFTPVEVVAGKHFQCMHK